MLHQAPRLSPVALAFHHRKWLRLWRRNPQQAAVLSAVAHLSRG
jgi:hypothetical protein